MKTAVVFACLLMASATAFAPSQRQQSTLSSAIAASTADFADAVGATAPFGVFDPLGIIETRGDAGFERLEIANIACLDNEQQSQGQMATSSPSKIKSKAPSLVFYITWILGEPPCCEKS